MGGCGEGEAVPSFSGGRSTTRRVGLTPKARGRASETPALRALGRRPLEGRPRRLVSRALPPLTAVVGRTPKPLGTGWPGLLPGGQGLLRHRGSSLSSAPATGGVAEESTYVSRGLVPGDLGQPPFLTTGSRRGRTSVRTWRLDPHHINPSSSLKRASPVPGVH